MTKTIEEYQLQTLKKRAIMREYNLRNIHGITPAMYETVLMLQNDACAICNEKPKGKKSYTVDMRMRGDLRGLLCTTCAIALGNFKKSPDMLKKALEYLTK